MNLLLIPSFVVPYFVLLINCLLFKLLRTVSLSITPLSFRTLISEFISTLELCSDCAELGVVWEIHGNIGYGIALFLLCIWWTQAFEDAEACPCGPIEDCILIGESFTSSETIQKLLGQVLGAIVTAKYINCVWCWHIVPEHIALHTNKCQASLQVSVLYGMTVEAIITFISRIVALESVHWNQNVSTYVNSLTTVFLVLAALNTTGGYFNPIMASALTLGCEGNTLFEHLSVYWIGSLIGGIIARAFHIFILRANSRHKID